jgi:hypothetical protein
VTITIEIKPEVEAELATQAAARGMDVPAYAAALLEQAAQPAPVEPQDHQAPPLNRRRPPVRKSLAQLFAESPFKGLDLDFERDRDLGRDMEL